MIIKAIVLDIDGTLLNTGKIISEKTKQALIAAQEKGIKVILASGRPTTGMLELAEQLEMTKYDRLSDKKGTFQSGHEYRNGPSNSRTLEKI